MNGPVILIEPDYVIAGYRSAEDAAMDIEAQDADEYLAYDHRGNRLIVKVISDNIVFERMDSNASYPHELEKIIIWFLAQVNNPKRDGLSSEWIAKASLDELINKLIEYKRIVPRK